MLNKHGIVTEVEFINNVAKSESENVLHEKNEAYTIFICLRLWEREREWEWETLLFCCWWRPKSLWNRIKWDFYTSHCSCELFVLLLSCGTNSKIHLAEQKSVRDREKIAKEFGPCELVSHRNGNETLRRNCAFMYGASGKDCRKTLNNANEPMRVSAVEISKHTFKRFPSRHRKTMAAKQRNARSLHDLVTDFSSPFRVLPLTLTSFLPILPSFSHSFSQILIRFFRIFFFSFFFFTIIFAFLGYSTLWPRHPFIFARSLYLSLSFVFLIFHLFVYIHFIFGKFYRWRSAAQF